MITVDYANDAFIGKWGVGGPAGWPLRDDLIAVWWGDYVVRVVEGRPLYEWFWHTPSNVSTDLLEKALAGYYKSPSPVQTSMKAELERRKTTKVVPSLDNQIRYWKYVVNKIAKLHKGYKDVPLNTPGNYWRALCYKKVVLDDERIADKEYLDAWGMSEEELKEKLHWDEWRNWMEKKLSLYPELAKYAEETEKAYYETASNISFAGKRQFIREGNRIVGMEFVPTGRFSPSKYIEIVTQNYKLLRQFTPHKYFMGWISSFNAVMDNIYQYYKSIYNLGATWRMRRYPFYGATPIAELPVKEPEPALPIPLDYYTNLQDNPPVEIPPPVEIAPPPIIEVVPEPAVIKEVIEPVASFVEAQEQLQEAKVEAIIIAPPVEVVAPTPIEVIPIPIVEVAPPVEEKPTFIVTPIFDERRVEEVEIVTLKPEIERLTELITSFFEAQERIQEAKAEIVVEPPVEMPPVEAVPPQPTLPLLAALAVLLLR